MTSDLFYARKAVQDVSIPTAIHQSPQHAFFLFQKVFGTVEFGLHTTSERPMNTSVQLTIRPLFSTNCHKVHDQPSNKCCHRTYNLVGIHDCLQAVCNRNDSYIIGNLIFERSLDDGIRLVIFACNLKTEIRSSLNIRTDCRSSCTHKFSTITSDERGPPTFVENQNLAPADHGTRQSEYLALPN